MRTDTLEEYRIRTSRLIKDLRGEDPDASRNAAKRFSILPEWTGQTPDSIVAKRSRIRRKHALTVIAREAGYPDWVAIKAALPLFDTTFDTTSDTTFDTARLFPPRSASFLNLWFRTYEEASAALAEQPARFLFPYRQHFVVCEPGFLKARGIDPDGADWQRIGHDWAKPRDGRAHARLAARLNRSIP
ncbi:MAG: hypothetical protein ABIZ80_10010 [Bryobacteraceae bacterium]